MRAFAPRRSRDLVDTRLDPRRPWAEDLFLRIPAGVEVCVRNDLASVTSYVLAEQNDWFEPELAFLRRWLRPGMTAVDVGASHGVFALTMARLVGPSGRVMAFEPGLEPHGLLERSIARNGLRTWNWSGRRWPISAAAHSCTKAMAAVRRRRSPLLRAGPPAGAGDHAGRRMGAAGRAAGRLPEDRCRGI